MSTHQVRIYDSKQRFWESERHGGEQEARDSAARWTSNNRSWSAAVWCGASLLATYRKGKEYRPRVKKEAKR